MSCIGQVGMGKMYPGEQAGIIEIGLARTQKLLARTFPSAVSPGRY
jgi:hypothetical protein